MNQPLGTHTFEHHDLKITTTFYDNGDYSKGIGNDVSIFTNQEISLINPSGSSYTSFILTTACLRPKFLSNLADELVIAWADWKQDKSLDKIVTACPSEECTNGGEQLTISIGSPRSFGPSSFGLEQTIELQSYGNMAKIVLVDNALDHNDFRRLADELRVFESNLKGNLKKVG